jgi:peptidyl-prolyl cis-trans isomerase A (cyclophilin A)
MRRFHLLVVLVAAPLAASPLPRVAIRTSEGMIVAEIDTARAPVTAANFLRYVDARRFDGKTFYRAARAKSDPTRGLIQGGINSKIRDSFFPIKHEPTSRTGLRHLDGTLSMARHSPNTAMGDFFITLKPAPALDAKPGYVGYAAFGRVVRGMEVARRILAKPTWPGGRSMNTIGQSIRVPVRIISARRVP